MSYLPIPLTRGLSALVSAEDFELLSVKKWHAVPARSTHYAARRTDAGVVYMHREIMGVLDAGRAVMVDHIDHDGLNNTRINLRLCTHAQNARNHRVKDDYLKKPGVSFEKSAWVARIRHQGRQLYLGSFTTEREAGIAYEAALLVAMHELNLKVAA